ncbi:MAG TPA: hypothetical protein VMH39_01515, partial [Gemmatimonadaceae bacterium]|nr:hypothetical protein [Gemmatimonadaceae bacterium]
METGTSVREALRALRNAPNSSDAASLSIVSDSAPPLELAPADVTPPRLEPAASLEGETLSREKVGTPVTGVAAFLDGVQTSRMFLTGPHGVPIVHGTAAAVVRRRSDRTLRVWGGAPRISRAIYAPLALLGEPARARLRVMRMEIVDTLTAADPPSFDHPALFLGLARHAVQERREALERALAEAWCESEREPLFVDGGVSGLRAASRSALVVGVVKSHRTLYVAPSALDVVTGLPAGERTTAFEIRRDQRGPVASWYLRLRDAAGRDPFFGLVRVEVARGSWTAERADEVSRWVLAERAPVSLPDRRWSTMAYGIRDCEEYLK